MGMSSEFIPEDEPKASPKIFEWYQSLIQSGQFVEREGGAYFYENVKIHLAIVAGTLTLVSYGITKQPFALILAAFVSLIGIVNAVVWIFQISANTYWQKYWYDLAGDMENIPEFQATVGTKLFKAYSKAQAEEKTKPERGKYGRTPKFRFTFPLILAGFFYPILVGCSLYFYNNPTLASHRIPLTISESCFLRSSTSLRLNQSID